MYQDHLGTGHINCNISNRGKIDVKSLNPNRYTNVDGNDRFEIDHPKEPIGVLPQTTGLEKL